MKISHAMAQKWNDKRGEIVSKSINAVTIIASHNRIGNGIGANEASVVGVPEKVHQTTVSGRKPLDLARGWMLGDERVFVDDVVESVAARNADPRYVTNKVTACTRPGVRTMDIVGIERETSGRHDSVKSRDAIGEHCSDMFALIHGKTSGT